MKKIFLLCLLLFVVACNSQLPNQQFCQKDDDCICVGIEKSTNNCFVGNRNYYESNAVDKSKVCPDFCNGIAGNLQTRCVENNCMNVNKNIFPECSLNSDCVPSDCFHASSCVPKDKSQKCEVIFGTQECRQGTIDCGGYCACEQKRCVAKNLYNSELQVPVV